MVLVFKQHELLALKFKISLCMPSPTIAIEFYLSFLQKYSPCIRLVSSLHSQNTMLIA